MTLLAMAVFSGMDATSKLFAASHHPVQVAWARYLFILLFLAPVVAGGRGRAVRTARLWLQLARGLCMLGSALFFIFALSRLPLATATSLGFVSPLLVTALSIPMLGERVGVRRWLAVAVGFAGVLIVVRPGAASFDPAALLPIASSACWAMGLIITRMMRGSEPVLTTLLLSTLVAFAATSLAVLPVWRPMPAEIWALAALMGGLSTVGQYFLIAAFRYAPPSLLAPFSYSQIVWATLLGLALFGTLPDVLTWVGAAVIVGSGIYTLHRERVLHRQVRSG